MRCCSACTPPKKEQHRMYERLIRSLRGEKRRRSQASRPKAERKSYNFSVATVGVFPVPIPTPDPAPSNIICVFLQGAHPTYQVKMFVLT